MTVNRGYEGASVPAASTGEPAPPATAELRAPWWVRAFWAFALTFAFVMLGVCVVGITLDVVNG